LNANKSKNLVSATNVSANTSDPTQLSCTPLFDHPDDVTVVTLNVSMPPPVLCSFANAMNAVTIARDHAIADTGATSIFIMEGVDVVNKRIATSPLQINLPDGKQVRSSHICDMAIPGLPTILTGYIVPSLTVASLIGIRPLCKAGCQVVFDDNKCDVRFNGNLILRGYKDPSTDLWTLPIRPNVCATPGQTVLPRSGPCLDRAPHSAQAMSMPVTLASFTHSVRTRVNAVKFSHQSLCSPKISSLLKAARRGFLEGCPNMTEVLILKYLNPSAATAKGHMKRPRHGIRSTCPKESAGPNNPPRAAVPEAPPVLPDVNPPPAAVHVAPPVLPVIHIPLAPLLVPRGPHLILDDDAHSFANIFCFGVFADRQSGIV
jgi:hypothetical protein